MPEVEQMEFKADEKTEDKQEIVEMNNMDEVRTPISMDGSVFSNLTQFKDAYMIGKYFAGSSLVPQSYQGKPMDCAIAVDIANRMGVSPMFVMQNLYVVRGVPSWSGQACMGIIRACGRFKDVKYNMVGEEGKDSFGCYVSAIDVATNEGVKGEKATISMAKAEGWYSKSGSKWQTMPGIMARYRAATFFARLYCPNELMGFKVEGESEDIAKADISKAIDIFADKNNHE